MTYVAEPLTQAIDELDNRILSLFGVAVPQPNPPTRPAPNPAPSAYWTNLVNSLSYAVGLPVYPGEGPYDEQFYLAFIPEIFLILGATQAYMMYAIDTGLSGAKHHIDASIRALEAALSATVGGAAGQAVAVAEALYNDAVARINAEAAARADGDRTVNAHAVADANAAAARAESYAYTRTHNLALALTAEQHARAQGDAHAVAVAAVLADQAEGRANAHSDSLFARAESDLAGVKVVLEGEIANGVHTAEQVAAGLAASAEANAVAQAVAQVQPTLDKVTTEVNTCLEPLCDTVTPNAKNLGNLGKYLKDFTNLGAAALLAGLVAEAIADPQAAADQINTAGGWLDGVAVELVNAV